MSAAWAAVIAAAITAVLGFFGNVALSKGQREKLSEEWKKNAEIADTKIAAEIEKDRAVTNTKIDELTREVREHNNFVHRVPLLESKMEAAEHRIDMLEHKTGA